MGLIMDNPLVSVIIPVYNGEVLVGKAIDSALNQNVDIEIIVINDCSSDNTLQILKSYNDDRIVVLNNEHNCGVAKSRNKGVNAARGKYIAFLDADDFWSEGKLKKQLELIEKMNAPICVTARRLLTPEGKATNRVIPVKDTITYKDLLKHNSISCSSVLMLTSIAKEFPMSHDNDSHEDYIMWLNVLKKYNFACGINEPLLNYRLSTKGKSGNKLKSAKMTFKAYKYSGLSTAKSIACFCSYAFNGVKKYVASYYGDKK